MKCTWVGLIIKFIVIGRELNLTFQLISSLIEGQSLPKMTKGILLASYGRMYETKVHYFHNLKLISVANSKQCEHNYLESPFRNPVCYLCNYTRIG